MTIGFIGLGIMGSRMATNLQNANHQLVVYNRTPAKAQALLDAGAIWADSPAQVAQQCSLLFTMLAHPQAVKAAALGPNGFLPELRSGKLWIDSSTVNPSFVQEMAQMAIKQRTSFLEAPVAGSKNQAAEAQLVFFVGGNATDFKDAQPFLELMGKKVIHVGDHGKAAALKIVVNLMLANSMAAFAEGLVLGESLGLSEELLFNILIGGPVAPPFLASKQASMQAKTYEVEFPLQWIQKDLQMATQTAFETGVALPITSAAKEAYRMAMIDGWKEKDFSAIYAYYQKALQ